ncbi:MAG TPA: coenzyme F420-0:L-glutamate ligase [Methanobacteriaceae archaeon]|nr:coenzyme F420-0:L-glutamate ligase [Methanobacteriaceae archaeon]
MEIKLLGLSGIPLINEGDDLGNIILTASRKQDMILENGDVLVVAETAIAKSEGETIDLNSIDPGPEALKIACETGKDPKLVELIIQESEEIIKVGPDFIISQTKHGFVCANAGIDESNVELGLAKPIPSDPDSSARKIKEKIESSTGKKVAVIISDTQGRAFREGAIGVAIGISGMEPLWDRRGEKDLYGRKLETTSIAVADELASAASIVMGQAKEGIPIVIIRGVNYFEHLQSNTASGKSLIRPKKYDVFR